MADESTQLDHLHRYASRILDVAATGNPGRTDHSALAANGLSFLLDVLTPLQDTLHCLTRQADEFTEIGGDPRSAAIARTCREVLDAASRIVDNLISGFIEWLVWVWVPALAVSEVSSGASIVTAAGLTGLMATRVGVQVVTFTETVTGLLERLRSHAGTPGQADIEA